MADSISASVTPINAIAATKGSWGTATPPVLDRAVNSLTDDMQEAVAALYRLETAMINSLTQSPVSEALLDEFKRARHLLREQWLNLREFFRNCAIYSEVYCIYFERPEFPRDILQKAQRVSAEAEGAKSKYNTLCEELQKQRAKLSNVLGSPGKQSQADFFNGKPPQAHLSSAKSPTISQAALEWSNPDGPASIVESYSALERISISLGDVAVFWKHHVDELGDIATSKPLPTASGQTRSSTAAWSDSKAILDLAVCSIQKSADAVSVNAVGAPPIRNIPNVRPLRTLRTFISGRLSKYRPRLAIIGRSRN